jgi:hypothetical protein|tara:strand:+ start:215 stop:1072 length:858 start_codon:yes stop_codon:yes gene_type:complete
MIGDDIIYEYPNCDRLVIIGDIHGDIKRLKTILIDAKIINNNIEWIAEPPNTVVVQMGDQVDSLNRDESIAEWEVLDDVEVIYFTNLLDKFAQSKGGRFISIIGNHEFMNVIGNYSYVSSKSMANNENKRRELFKAKGVLSPILSKRPIVLKIGELFFCHAGLTTKHLELLKKYGKDISYINRIWKNFVLHGNVLKEDKEIFDNILLDYNGILWTRELDNQNDLNELLKSINCTFMFVGHTVMDGIKFYNNKVWYTDTGISRAFGNNKYQYMEIINYHIHIKEIK